MANQELEEESSADTERDNRERVRSPNYPSMKFTDAVEATRKIWEQEKRLPVSVDVASAHLGYKKANGITLPMIGSMKRYGLLISSGKDVRVSDDAHKIFVYPEGAPETEEVKKRLAMKPSLFGQVLARFPDGLPSDANLRARLLTEWGFVTEKAADNFIASLREAVSVAGQNGVAGAQQVVDTGEVIATEPVMPQCNQTASNPSGNVIQRTSPSVASPSLNGQGYQPRAWNLGGGVTMVVNVPNNLSAKQIEKLKKYVAVLEQEASIAWEDEADGSDGN